MNETNFLDGEHGILLVIWLTIRFVKRILQNCMIYIYNILEGRKEKCTSEIKFKKKYLKIFGRTFLSFWFVPEYFKAFAHLLQVLNSLKNMRKYSIKTLAWQNWIRTINSFTDIWLVLLQRISILAFSAKCAYITLFENQAWHHGKEKFQWEKRRKRKKIVDSSSL